MCTNDRHILTITCNVKMVPKMAMIVRLRMLTYAQRIDVYRRSITCNVRMVPKMAMIVRLRMLTSIPSVKRVLKAAESSQAEVVFSLRCIWTERNKGKSSYIRVRQIEIKGNQVTSG